MKWDTQAFKASQGRAGIRTEIYPTVKVHSLTPYFSLKYFIHLQEGTLNSNSDFLIL